MIKNDITKTNYEKKNANTIGYNCMVIFVKMPIQPIFLYIKCTRVSKTIATKKKK